MLLYTFVFFVCYCIVYFLTIIFQDANRKAAPVSVTSDAIEHAMMSPHPKTRYPLVDAKPIVLLSWWVSDRFRDYVLAKLGF